MEKHLFYLLFFTLPFSYTAFSQTVSKTLPAKRTSAGIKIDGKLEESAWKEAIPATGFVEWRPNFGAIEDETTKTEIYLLYDNTAIYIGGYCHEKSRDSVSKELVGRDKIGVSDYVGVIFDTYLDKINGVGFYVTPLGEQFDAKYSTTFGEDGTWNAVWDSEAEVVNDGWTFEMKIPYSALRFVSKDNQSWGLNITRNRKKVGRQFMWNPVDPKINGLMNQEGSWTGIEKIDAPVRLSFTPYFSTYLNHYPAKTSGVKDWTTSINGGMDVKYGISDAFTLDMTLIPDFGQVQSDNQVLNLSPFEVRYNENRSFFTEGTELFNKGNLFYSRRIGGAPIHLGNAYDNLGTNEEVLKNPSESKLINATKVSGRTKKGFGLGVFNAITKTTYATIENTATNETRKIQTNPLTNYNILVFDQTMKNNSSVSFINTNTIRNGKDHDANVSAALFDFNNKKNIYNLNGKIALSQLIFSGKNTNGYSHNINFSKAGNWSFQLGEELVDDKYDINDMGILYNNNYIDHFLWTAYRWLKPKKWYNRIQVNYNAYYSLLYKDVPNQKINSKFQTFSTNVNANIQMKNLWWAGMFVGYVTKGNDFYESRETGYSFRTPRRIQFNPWFETNSTKKYYASFNYFVGLRSLFNSPNHEVDISHRYRFNDRFSISHNMIYNPTKNDAGFYDKYYEKDTNGILVLDGNGNPILEDILFSRRDRKTIENVLSFKYNFNNKSGITVRARHYWSRVKIKQLYDLENDGILISTTHTNVVIEHQNYNIFNVDAVYTLQFAPGSFINIVWKDQSETFNDLIRYRYFKNFGQTLDAPQNNNLSIKVIYYLDYLDFKKWKKKNV
jgi:Domain of unknown function (DUF5916)